MIEARDLGYISQAQSVELNFTGPCNVTFVLTEHAFTTIDLEIFDPVAQENVQGAFVNLTDTDAQPTTGPMQRLTGYPGWANFTDDVGLGNYSVTVSRPGYATLVQVYSGIGWGPGSIIRTIDLTAVGYVRLFAWVRDANTSYSIRGAEVTVGLDWSTFSDPYGNASLPPYEVPGGSYFVVANATGYYPWSSPGTESFCSVGVTTRNAADCTGRFTNLTIWLRPTPKIPCNSSDPTCQKSTTGTQTKGNFSLLPFASGPEWPFFVFPPLFFVGALVYFLATRRTQERSRSRRVAVAPARG